MALLQSGQVTSSGTAAPLTLSRPSCKKWIAKALSSNTSAVYVGGTGVSTSTGFIMEPGDDFEIDNTIQNGAVYEVTPGDFYVVGTGGVVSWLAFQ